MTICMKVQTFQYLELGPCLTSEGHVTQVKSKSNNKINLQLSLVIVAWCKQELSEDNKAQPNLMRSIYSM